ncbi:GNAT family N-acetyltransferase [Micromonospora chaiyaphumensis]|uniref:Predicted acetyltransferase n=1 Tax=Micromonospora chaiyaphumensis TaxID=307119 RepID=A0A1C4W098_9ACTN|nr:GNAT family N-acetyltransferase [Micromonospora chaiyaphumensis]SCE89647.1 Predicted acetyltransferase [Micromonospora chaiyaphumensis]
MTADLPAGMRLVEVTEERYGEWLDSWLGAFASPPGDDPEVVDFYRRTHPPHRAIAITDEAGYVATNASLHRDLVLPGGRTVPLAACTGGSCHPTLRRKGLMKATLHRLHERAVEEGKPIAAGGVSEWPIYWRFGYGPATWYNSLNIDVRGVGWRADAPDGDLPVRRVSGKEARDLAQSVYERQAARTPGEVIPPSCYWDRLAMDPTNPRLEQMLAIGGGGAPRACVAVEDRGFVSYRITSDWAPETTPRNMLQVIDFLAVDAEAAATLWRYLLSVDMVATIQVWYAPVDNPLAWWVTDARKLRAQRHDGVWLRPLDVPTLLEARGWAGDGALTLRVHDPEGHTDGTFRLDVDAGQATCRRSTAEPDLEMHVAAVGAILLGGTAATDLARGGRIVARDPRCAQLWDTMATPERAPYISYFY